MKLKPRVIPCLLIKNLGLVKTVRFSKPKYLGDPINAVRIFNEKEVDELVILDIAATEENREPDYKALADIASECFMPLGYGGGVRDVRQIERLFKLGIEKVCINTQAALNPNLVKESARLFGSQSIISSIDVKRKFGGKYEVLIKGGRTGTKTDPVAMAKRMEDMGAGEIFLNSIDRDGTMEGYDLDLIRRVSEAVSIPVVACGGAGSVDDIGKAIKQGQASAAAAGSLFVFQGKHRAVLINFPAPDDLNRVLK